MRRELIGLRFCGAMALVVAAMSLAAPGARAHSMQHGIPAMGAMPAMPMKNTMPGLSIYNLGTEWRTQSKARVRLASLAGQPVLAAMVYTNCTDICPLITERMHDIQRALPAPSRDKIELVLFSLDWVRDTPRQLKIFASQHRLDLQRWTLLHGEEDAVRELAAALGVSFHRDAKGDFQHSIVIFLLDSRGVVAAQETDFARPASAMAAAIQRLLGVRRAATRQYSTGTGKEAE